MRSRAAFTLTELLIVVALMGIAAAAAVPALWTSLDRSRLDAAASELEAAVRVCRDRAMASGLPARVAGDIAQNRATLEVARPASDLTQDQIPAEDVETLVYVAAEHPLAADGTYTLDFAGQGRFGTVRLSYADFDGDAFVTFDALGQAAEAGEFRVALGGMTQAIRVTQAGAIERVTR
jgi:type II secretion system protein H